MDVLLSIFIFIFGTIIGSFLNVIILRYHTNLSVIKGRSVCFSCHKSLQWFEMIPILSFLYQKGRCRGCQSKFSWQYPLIEFITGIIFFLIFFKFYFSFLTLYFLLIFSLLIVILGYDFRHKIIPDGLVYSFIGLSLASFFIWQNPNIWDFLAGPILAFPIFLLWFISQGRWIGLGDAKLIFGMGLLLGFSNGLSAVIISFWLGAIIGLLLIIFSHIKKSIFNIKDINLKSEIPFAPFLILGTFLVFFFEWTIMDLSKFFVLI